MSRRLEYLLVAISFWLILVGVYADKLYGPGYIFTETIQDITNIYGFYPWDSFSAYQLSDGRFPLWNPHNGLGIPHLADMQTGVFFPLNWIKFFFNFWSVIDWLLIFRLWLAGYFLYLFTRKSLGLNIFSAIFSGLNYMLCGYFLRYIYMSHINVECLIPFQLYIFHQLWKKRNILFWCFSGLGIYLLITGGFPEASLYGIGFSVAYFLFGINGVKDFGKKLWLAFSVLGFGFLLASVQWLGFYEYLGQAWSYHQAGVGIRHLDLAYIISGLLPWFYGKNLESTLVPFLLPGLGTVAVILGLRAILGINSNYSFSWFWVLSTIILIGIIYGIIPFIWLGYIFPFSLTYNFKYAVPVLSLSVSVLAGIGVGEFLKGERRFWDLLSLGIVWFWAGLNLIFGLLNKFEPFYAFGLGMEMLRLVVVIFALVLIMFLSKNQRLWLVSKGLILALVIGSIYFDYSANRGIDRSNYLFAQIEEAKQLKRLLPEPGRFSAEGEILFPNFLLGLGVDDIRSYSPLYPKTYVYLLASINGLKTQEQINQHYNQNKLFQINRGKINSALVPILNLRLYAVDYELNSVPLAEPIIKKGRESGDFAGWTRSELIEISEESKKALLMHSSGRIDMRLEPKSEIAELHFDIGIKPVNGEFLGDGAQFQFLFQQGDNWRIGYSRFLNPAIRKEDQGWKKVSLNLGIIKNWFEFCLVGLSGPRGDNYRDYLGWAGIRLIYPGVKMEGIVNLTELGEISLNYFGRSYNRYYLVDDVEISSARNIEEELTQFIRLNQVEAGYFQHQAIINGKTDLPKRRGAEVSQKRFLNLVKAETEEVELNLGADKDYFLVSSEQYFPGWRARVDEKEVRIYRANLALRAIFIEQGRHKVKFWYEPWSFHIGLWTSLIGFLVGMIFNFGRIFFRVRKG